jgi:hypothetical protein
MAEGSRRAMPTMRGAPTGRVRSKKKNGPTTRNWEDCVSPRSRELSAKRASNAK